MCGGLHTSASYRVFPLAPTGRGSLCEKALGLFLVWSTPEWPQIPNFRAGHGLRDSSPKTHY